MTRQLRRLVGQSSLIAAATAGGWLFLQLGIAAPWLSGAMLVAVLLSAAGASEQLHPTLRDASMVIAGVAMGAAVTPEALAAVAKFPISLLLLAIAIVAILAASTLVLVKVSGWPVRDAFFASAPGSLTAVLILAATVRADVARIALLQTCRIFVLVLILPSVITAIEPAMPALAREPPQVTALGLAALFIAALAGAWLFDRLRIAGPLLMGSMAGSAVLTGSGAVGGTFPPSIAIVGFVLIGIFIGQRFRGTNAGDLMRILPAAALSLMTTLGMAAAFVGLVVLAAGVDVGPAAVAFAPGGLEAMTVLAVALGLDPLYVSVHHLFRFVFVAFVVGIIMRMIPGLGARGTQD